MPGDPMKKVTEQISVSEDFKKHATRAIASIALFLIVYLILAAGSVALSLFCLWAALELVINAPAFITVLVALGIASVGLLISIFLFKFIFSSNKVDRSDLVEVFSDEEPELFAMIGDIVNKVQTKFPKRVYFSNDVNAAVFYDSTFWSMFFPIKKNLQIGMGLINTVSKEELKAILSHEFGHFSQRSMKVGSYVYNANKIIYNMLYENGSYNKLISFWSGIHAIISILIWVVIKIVTFMQWVLKLIYGLINRSHAALSRTMEFHADEVAASVTGSQPLIDALLRSNFADHSLNMVLSFYGERVARNIKSENVYREQFWVMLFLAGKDKLPLKNDLPLVTTEFLEKFNRSKLVIKDQWASHPATEERVARLKQLNYPDTDPSLQLANTMIAGLEEHQLRFSNRFFANVPYEQRPEAMSIQAFQEEYAEKYQKDTFHEDYNGYYDVKPVYAFDLDAAAQAPLKPWAALFSTEMVNNTYIGQALRKDIETLSLIPDKKYGVKSFDYDGSKYLRKESGVLKSQLEAEEKACQEAVHSNDRSVYRYFLNLEEKLAVTPRLKHLYQDFFDFDEQFEKGTESYQNLRQGLEFIQYSIPPDKIIQNFSQIKPEEDAFIEATKKLIGLPILETVFSDQERKAFGTYLNERLVYFDGVRYYDENLNILFSAMEHYISNLQLAYFLYKKEILDYQIELENNCKLKDDVQATIL